MRRIFPPRSGDPGKQPNKKDKSSELSFSSSSSSSSSSNFPRRESFRNKHQQQQQQGDRTLIVEKTTSTHSSTKREHWCPASNHHHSPGLITQRCETPPSGDENSQNTHLVAMSGDDDSKNSSELVSISQTRLGLPEECQDKQVLRPSIVATSRSSSPSPASPPEWTSGLQAALDQLVIESRQELRRKFVSEPPSPATSPPLIEKRSHADVEKLRGRALKSIKLEPEHPDQPEVSSRLSHPVNFSEVEDNSSTGAGASQEFEPANQPRLTRSFSRSSNDGASILSNPRSHSFSDWSRGGGGVASSENFSREVFSSDDHQVDQAREKSHFKYLNARAVAEKLAKAIRGNSRPKELKQRLPPLPQTPPRSLESTSGSLTMTMVNNKNKVVKVLAPPRFAGNDDELERRPRAKQESDFFKRQLDSHSTQMNFVYENLSERVLRAERQLSASEAEMKSSGGGGTDRNATRLSTRELERLEALNKRIRKLLKEKSELAREVVAEVRLRNMERLTVREVVELMKRDTEFWIRSLEQDKLEMERGFGVSNNANQDARKLAEEKSWLERELAGVTSKESALRMKVREFELQMQAHVSRVESAERTILDLRESLVSGQKKMIQLEQEDEQLRRSLREKEGENSDLRKLVGRLQQLCSDHEKSIRGLWDSLRSLSHDRSEQKVGRLQAEVLRLSEVELGLRRELEASRVEASGMKREEGLARRLQESLEAQRKLEREISGLVKQNEELQRKQSEENPCSAGQQQHIIDGLQQSLSDMTHALNTQNSRIQRLTGRNEELYKLYSAKEKEFHELQTRAREENESRKTRDDEQKQVRDTLKNLQSELQVQQLHCNMLKEKVAGKEMELEQCRAELGDSSQSRRMLQEEVTRLRRLVENSTQRISELEHQLREKEQKLGALNSELRPCVVELNRLRDEMPRVIRQRDSMKLEAEQLGREALRMSAEAEVLRRRVNELEEEVMLRDGHLSILRGSLNNDEDC